MNSLVLRDILRSAFVTPLVCMQRDYWRWMAAHSGSVVNVVAATARGGSQDAALAAWLSAELAPRVNVHPPSYLAHHWTPARTRQVLPSVCELQTHRTDSRHGPVLVLSVRTEDPDCPSRTS
ncbi:MULTISPECIES: hypothetical protein [Streptomyces]|uniref:hypothetical protein n=1 Tax=Streptomyces TaxID=1883 RepID=UPI002E2EDEB3|nr:hypothetical protein [Streptomyces canus]WSZ34902.1 hypothetical protein OG806_38430 [Streptomyces sp. NBC_00882]